MNIKPTPDFLQACAEVLGEDVEDMTPAVVIMALRNPELGDRIREVNARIVHDRLSRETAIWAEQFDSSENKG